MSTLVIAGDKGGCAYYRAVLPAKNLGYELSFGTPIHETEDAFNILDRRLDECDNIILQRVDGAFFDAWVPEARRRGQNVVYEIDDNIWCIPDGNIAKGYYTRERLDRMTSIMKKCNSCIVSTRRLQQFIKNCGYNKNVVVVPNMVAECFELRPSKERYELRLGWWGSATHRDDYSRMLMSLYVMMSYTHAITFIGYKPFNRVPADFIDWVEPENLLKTIYDSGIDVTMIPVRPNIFNRCKSDIKFLEASACGIATIARELDCYNTVKHGKTGLQVSSDHNWDFMLNRMLNDKHMRDEIREEANKWVRENRCWTTCAGMVREIHESIGVK